MRKGDTETVRFDQLSRLDVIMTKAGIKEVKSSNERGDSKIETQFYGGDSQLNKKTDTCVRLTKQGLEAKGFLL